MLKGIRFRTVSVTVLSVEYLPRVLVAWTLEPTTQDLRNLNFFVERGESPSEFRRLNGVPIRTHELLEYVDTTSNLTDLNKIYYYRVVAEEAVDGAVVQRFESPQTTSDGNLDLVGLYIVDEFMFAHRWVYGVPAMVFKKRRDGLHCPECWDTVLKRVTKSNCHSCYGTGVFSGFYPPIEVWMSFNPDPRVAQVVDWGVRQSSQTDIQFVNYPLLAPDDLIVELKPNRIWKVEMVQYPEKNRTVLLQMARLNAVNPTDVEYHLPVPEDRRIELVKDLARREEEREF